jgi:hypothetical protein
LYLDLLSNRQGSLDQRYDLLEALRIGYRHIGQDFAVQFDVGYLQPGYKLAIAQPVLPDRGVYADDPQLAEFSFTVPPVAEGIYACADECFLSGSNQFASTADKAFHLFEKAFF